MSEEFSRYDIIVDALLGTGISKPLEGLYSKVVATINQSEAFVLSVDIPSGMFSDSLTGGVPTVQAAATVTFTAPGEYLLRVLANDRSGGGGSQCCWTNAFVRVNVSE